MELRHYAGAPLELDRERVYPQDGGDLKPRGFWVSVLGPDDWPSWCRSEDWGLGRLTVEHEVTLAAEANVRLITSHDEFDAFHDEFAIGLVPGSPLRYIDWERVTSLYDGIIIAPYLWNRRLGDAAWYYGWDCASGCIWNLSAIESITVRETSDL
jgi:hypothetical protein